MTRSNAQPYTFLRRALLVLCLWMGMVVSLVAVSQQASAQVDLEQATTQFNQLAEQLETLRTRRVGLEREYGALTNDIAARKRAGEPQKLLGDLELQGLLKRGRTVADELYRIQSRIREVEAQLLSARRRVLSGFDTRLAGLEEVLVDGSGSSRAAIIAEMNRLRRARHEYVAEMQSTPDLILKDLPSLDDVAEDPEEALAAAAELDDATRKLRDRIENLDGEISSLESQRRLRRKAKSFREKESFFDEAQKGGRRVAARPVGTRSSAGTDESGVANDGATAEGAVADSQENSRGGDEPVPLGDEETDGDMAAGGSDELSGADGSNEGPPAAAPAGSGDPAVAPDIDGPSDPFAGEGTVVIGEVESFGTDQLLEDESLESRLRRYKRERKQLERKSRQLERRSGDLKRLADGF